LVVFPLAGCGFTPGASVGDACSLLTLADAQTLIPTAGSPSGYTLHAEAEREAVVCQYSSDEQMRIDFLVTMPLTRAGDDAVNDRLTHGLSGETMLDPVGGLGDAAVTYVLPGSGHGIRAKSQGDLLDLFVWSSDPLVPSVANLVAAMHAAVSRMPSRGR
jgi:hypothetical protein